MTKKIFNGMLIFLLLEAVLSAILALCLAGIGADRGSSSALERSTELICAGVRTSGRDYLSAAGFDGLRITWLSSSGEVLYDSDNGIPDTGEEFDEAKENGTGSSRSHSIRSNSLTISRVSAVGDGTYIRTASEGRLFSTAKPEIAVGLLLYLAVSMAVAWAAARLCAVRTAGKINRLDLSASDRSAVFPELEPLLDKVFDQHKRIAAKMEELRRSREQFSLITESMKEGLVIADRKLNILASNSAAFRLLETDAVEEGRSIFALNNSETFRRCIQDAAGGRRAECIIKAKNGDREVIASPANSRELVNGIVVFIMDVTEKQQLEVMRREFTSNVSHELKTPLTTIYGISDMLANGIVKPEDVSRFGKDIHNEASRLITLIDDIVSLSRLDENAVPDKKEDVDLYDLAGDVIERLKSTAEQKNVRFVLSGVHVTCSGNRTVLDEMIYNLCDNAIKYNDPGGSCEVKVSHIPQKALITVSDTGIGIPEQHLSRIFERFYRVDKSRSRKIKGTGLGLSIVKHGVMYHGGTVRVESTPGKGTTFTVELPLK